MIWMVGILIVSFFLEGILTNYLPVFTSILFPLFTITSFIVIFPYFYRHEKKFFFILGTIGLWYDIVYTHSIGYHLFFFLFLGLVIEKFFQLVKHNYWNLLLILFVVIILYRGGTFLFLVMFGELPFRLPLLFSGITSSLLINFLYFTLLYWGTNCLYRRMHLVRFN